MFRIIRASKLRIMRNRLAAEQFKLLGADTTAQITLDLLREWYSADDCQQSPSAILRARTAMVLGEGPKPQPGRVVVGVVGGSEGFSDIIEEPTLTDEEQQQAYRSPFSGAFN